MNQRARVPFALVGVLLLGASGTIAVSVHDPVRVEPAVDAGMDRLTAEVHTALRAAVRDAAHGAAEHPVVVPANTSVGRALSEHRPFEDALRLRIYEATADRLERLTNRRRGVSLSASLPDIDGKGSVRAAIERVHLAPAGPKGRAIAVRVEDVRLRASRDGRLVGESRLEPDLVVETPILLVHDKVTRYQRRLNASVGRPGLASRLTAVLYPVAWARGYAQFRGQPIENVVANRHLALVTNGAVLAEQRASFGTSDPVGRAVYGRTIVETGMTDLVRGTNSSTVARLNRLARATGLRESDNETLARLEPGRHSPQPSDSTTIEIDRTADLAYLRAVRSIDEPIGATYSPAARVRRTVRTVHRERLAAHHPPDLAGGVLDSHTTYDTTVEDGSATPPTSRPGWHEIANYSRRVVVEEHTAKQWSMPGNATAVTTGTVRLEKRVGLLISGNHTVGPAPNRPIPSVHSRGGPLDGPNLADAPERIRERLVEGRGGPDALAARAAIGRLDTDAVRVEAAIPEGLAGWIAPNLSALHDEVSRISVSVPRGEIATFQANVPGMLAERLGARREELVDPPQTYGSVAERARVGVRAAYVDRVQSMLAERAAQARTGREGLRDALPGEDPERLLRDGYREVGSPVRGADPPGIPMTVDASPSYLTVKRIGHQTVPAIPQNGSEHPLVVRNVNAFSLPTTGVVEALFGLLSGPDKTSLRSAARVLEIATARGLDTSAPGRDVSALEADVSTGSARIQAGLVAVLARNDIGSRNGRREVVRTAIERWDGTGTRANALSNGSVAEAVYEATVERWPDAVETVPERKRLAVGLEFAVETARDDELFQPRQSVVEGTADTVRAVLGTAETGLAERVADRTRRRAEALTTERAAAIAARLPGGVPVVPAPGMWYAMVNAWHVQVRGSYVRFAVRVPNGAPDRMPPELTYVRESAPVRLDVDGDGSAERLGENRRIDFAAETVVAVAVPPKPQGVGDVTERDEKSPGWPDPGPAK